VAVQSPLSVPTGGAAVCVAEGDTWAVVVEVVSPLLLHAARVPVKTIAPSVSTTRECIRDMSPLQVDIGNARGRSFNFASSSSKQEDSPRRYALNASLSVSDEVSMNWQVLLYASPTGDACSASDPYRVGAIAESPVTITRGAVEERLIRFSAPLVARKARHTMSSLYGLR
jgi:hypothetical protein